LLRTISIEAREGLQCGSKETEDAKQFSTKIGSRKNSNGGNGYETETSVKNFDQNGKPEELELGEEWGRLEGLEWEPKEMGGEATFKENRKPEELKSVAERTRRWPG
jgi:hypothetical protein